MPRPAPSSCATGWRSPPAGRATTPAPPSPATTARSAEVGAVQGNVLEGLRPEEFTLTHRWRSINAFAGEVNAAGLRKLVDDPDVLMVDVDPPAWADLAESAALIRADQVRGMGVTGRG